MFVLLSFDAIRVGQALTLINGNKLDLFEAQDDDAGAFGDINFRLTSENGDHDSFEIIKVNRKQSELRITKEIEERSYLVRFWRIFFNKTVTIYSYFQA